MKTSDWIYEQDPETIKFNEIIDDIKAENHIELLELKKDIKDIKHLEGFKIEVKQYFDGSLKYIEVKTKINRRRKNFKFITYIGGYGGVLGQTSMSFEDDERLLKLLKKYNAEVVK